MEGNDLGVIHAPASVSKFSTLELVVLFCLALLNCGIAEHPEGILIAGNPALQVWQLAMEELQSPNNKSRDRRQQLLYGS
jgi:hypothetical protein